jgi:S1-C subfamily serine protease
MKMLTLDASNPQTSRIGTSSTAAKRCNTRGVVVIEVLPGSPAQKSGLRMGDLVIKFDGLPVHSTRDILSRVGFEVGRAVPLVVERDGTELELQIVTEAVGAGAPPSSE